MATHKDGRRDRILLEDSYGLENVPYPGDTLPWNLSKHQRIKRSKSASGEVLDPAERAVIRIAGRMHLLLTPSSQEQHFCVSAEDFNNKKQKSTSK